MKHTKLTALLLCLCMVVSMFAACGNNSDTQSQGSNSAGGNVDTASNDQYIDQETGEIINIGSPMTMKVTPEEVGALENPVVTGLEAWINESRIKSQIAWKEEAYGLIYDYDTCDESSRMAKWVSAFVAGDAYDVLWLLSTDFPIIAQNGLVQPLEKIMPVYDENYFHQAVSNCFTWKGRVYAVNPGSGVDTYGVHYNMTLFENAGETTPLEYYENGEWTFETFLDLAKAMNSVEGTADDIYGLTSGYNYLVQCAIVSNGGSVLKYTDTGADINLTDPKTMEALEWTNQIRAYTHEQNMAATYNAGKAAMFIERYNSITNARRSAPNYEFSWVPFPTGPSGEGEQTGLVYAWAIGKGAKNIEGAMAWIAADRYRETWFEMYPSGSAVSSEETSSTVSTSSSTYTVDPEQLQTERTLRREATAKGRMDNYEGFGFGIWLMLEDAKSMGMAAAVEKHTPSYQAIVDQLLAVEAQVGKLDFEDQGVYNFDTAESEYPFINVIEDDKFVFGTDDVQSLKIDLSGMSEFGAIAYTNPELFKLQNGGQYKVSFKLYSDVDPGAEALAVAARTTDALDGSPTFGLTWLAPKAGEITEVEVFINVNGDFNGDLAVVLLGSATYANPDLNIVIDDFHVELIAGE